MFLDASVIVAILGREPGFEEIEKRLTAARTGFFVSPLVKFEASMALARLKAGSVTTSMKPSPSLVRNAIAAVDAFVDDLGIEEMSVTPEIGRMAMEASATYGKTVGHKADLNFGDCFAYACAKSQAVPLVYKGSDFAHTDLA